MTLKTCDGIFEAFSHSPMAHLVTHENLMLIATSKATTDFTNFTEIFL